MNRAFQKSCIVVLLLSLNFQFVSSAFAQATLTETSVAEIALLEGENRLQRLIEGAKKEGELTVYGSLSVENMSTILDLFTKKYGVKVKLWRSGSENILQRILNESRSGRNEADILITSAPEVEALHREKMLQQVKSPYHTDLLPAAIPAHKDWVGATINVYVQAYNTSKVKKEELPKTYQDLLDPKWKGRLGIEGDNQAWFATLVQAIGPEKGKKLFKDIVDANGISVRKGHSLLNSMVASGEVPLALTLYYWQPEQVKQKGAPVEWFVIPPAIAQLVPMGLLKKAPHPHAAVLFYDFILNEGQQILAKRDNIPTSTKIDTPIKNLPLTFIDPALFLDMNQLWVKDYEESVTKRTKR